MRSKLRPQESGDVDADAAANILGAPLGRCREQGPGWSEDERIAFAISARSGSTVCAAGTQGFLKADTPPEAESGSVRASASDERNAP